MMANFITTVYVLCAKRVTQLHDVVTALKRGIAKKRLHKAAKEGNTDLVEALIKAGTDINAQDAQGNTALHVASRHGQITVIKILIEAGAGVNAKDDNGMTALMWAERESHTDIARILKDAGAVE